MNRTEDEIVDRGRHTLVKKRLDARGYRDWLISMAKRSRIANLLGKRVRSVPAFAESHLLQSRKKQRLKEEVLKTSKWEKSSKLATFNDHNLDQVDSVAGLCVQSSVKEGRICSRVRSSKLALFGHKRLKERDRPNDCRRQILSDKRRIHHLKEDKLLIHTRRKIVSDEMVMQELKDREITIDFQGETVPDRKVDQDLEDGEIPTNSQGEIISYEVVIRDLEEGEIPTNSLGESLSEKSVDQDLEDSETPYEDFRGNTPIHKMTVQDLEEGEMPSDFRGNAISDGNVVRDLEEGETTVDSQDQIVSGKEVVQDLEEGEISSDSQTEIYSRNWEGRDCEVGEIIIDYQEGCLSDNVSDQNMEDQEMPIGCQRQIVPDKVTVEEGTMEMGLRRQDLPDLLVPADVEQTVTSPVSENDPDEQMEDFHSDIKSEVEHLRSSNPLSSTGESTVNQVGKTLETHPVSGSEISVSELHASDISVIRVSSGNASLEVVTSSAKSIIFGEVPNQPPTASNSFLKQKNLCGLPVEAVNDSENEETEGNDEENVSDAYTEHQNEVSRSPKRCKDDKTDCLGRQDVSGNVEKKRSEERHSGAVEAQQREVIIIDDVTESPYQTMPTPIVVMASEEATTSVTEESRQPLPSTYSTSGSSFTKISSVGLPSVTSNVQLTLPTIASCASHGSSELPSSADICRTPSYVSRASSPEAQFEGGPFTEELAVDHDIFVPDLQLPPLAFTHARRSEMPVPNNRSTAQRSDFRSSNTNTGSSSVPHPTGISIPHETHLLSSSDPLLIEMGKILKEDEQDFRTHEDLAFRIRFERERAINEVFAKYDILLKNAEAALQQKRKERCEVFDKVCANKLLAQVMKLSISKSSDEASNLVRTIQMFVQLNGQFADLRQDPFLATSVSAVEYLSHPSATLSAPSTISHPLIGQMGSFQNGEGGGPPLLFGGHVLYSSTSNVPAVFSNGNVMRSTHPGNQFFGLNSSPSSGHLSTFNIGAPNQQMPNAY